MNTSDWLDRFRNVTALHEVFTKEASAQELVGFGQEMEKLRAKLLASVALLEAMLTDKRERDLYALPGLLGFYPGRCIPFEAKELRRLESVAARLWTATGTGRTSVEEALLGLIAVAADVTSLPFYRAALLASRPRDVFQPQRRRMVVAAIASLAERTGSPEAHAELERILTHPEPTVRGEAVEHYARLHLTRQGKLRAEPAKRLRTIAEQDRDFVPRFLARLALMQPGRPVPIEPSDGVYAFRIWLGNTSRTVELHASQSLAELASAILNAFGWDHDHLYEFAMTGDLRDRRFVLPTAEEEALPLDFRASSPSSVDLPVGGLGLQKGLKFIFRYDFGDDNRFTVLVTAVHPHKERRTRYPRVVAHTGKAPEQYAL